MDTPRVLFLAFEIRDAIGELADGRPIDSRLLPFIGAAVTGLSLTSDRGQQQFVVGISGCDQFNVDTEELIWPRVLGEDIGDDVPLRVLTDRFLWDRYQKQWEQENLTAWTAFIWRIAVPLSNQLEFVGAWG